jgi:hypothetical protein
MTKLSKKKQYMGSFKWIKFPWKWILGWIANLFSYNKCSSQNGTSSCLSKCCLSHSGQLKFMFMFMFCLCIKRLKAFIVSAHTEFSSEEIVTSSKKYLFILFSFEVTVFLMSLFVTSWITMSINRNNSNCYRETNVRHTTYIQVWLIIT